MLFLLPLDMLNKPGEENISCTMDDLFHIHTGVLDTPNIEYYIKSEKTQQESIVRILRMSSFNPIQQTLKSTTEIEQGEKRIKDLRTLRNKVYSNEKQHHFQKANNSKATKERQALPDYKLLDSKDYVINTRSGGELPITGYSLMEGANQSRISELEPVSISHHFIIIKPRASVLNQISVEFLHILLNVFINKYSKTITATSRLLKTRDLKETRVQFPKSPETQQEIIKKYNSIKNEIAIKVAEFDELSKNLADQLVFKH
jgi:hypothetical protein